MTEIFNNLDESEQTNFEQDPRPFRVLYAYHGYEYYDGEWYILATLDDGGEERLYRDVGGHCSSGDWYYWEPEPTTWPGEISRLADRNRWNFPVSYADEAAAHAALVELLSDKATELGIPIPEALPDERY